MTSTEVSKYFAKKLAKKFGTGIEDIKEAGAFVANAGFKLKSKKDGKVYKVYMSEILALMHSMREDKDIPEL